MKIEYLGTGANPINVPTLETEKPISKGDRVDASDAAAISLIEQGLFKAVEDGAYEAALERRAAPLRERFEKEAVDEKANAAVQRPEALTRAFDTFDEPDPRD